MCAGLLALGTWSAHARDTLTVVTNYYEVRGSSVEEILQDMERARADKPGKMHGATTWEIKWRYRYRPTTEGCELVSMDIHLRITITMPKLILDTKEHPDLWVRWVRYWRALWKHEQGHKNLAMAAMAELRKLRERINTREDCATLERELNQEANRIVARFKARDAEYDQATRHGATQGAVFR